MKKVKKLDKLIQKNCEHDWESVIKPRDYSSGIHKDVCRKCGKTKVYDTSD